jgi:hypothetical protein
MFVIFNLEGTSNSTTTSFTLPNNALTFNETMQRFVNNGAITTGFTRITNASNVIQFGPTTTTLTWTASGSKSISGQFYIDIA